MDILERVLGELLDLALLDEGEAEQLREALFDLDGEYVKEMLYAAIEASMADRERRLGATVGWLRARRDGRRTAPGGRALE